MTRRSGLWRALTASGFFLPWLWAAPSSAQISGLEFGSDPAEAAYEVLGLIDENPDEAQDRFDQVFLNQPPDYVQNFGEQLQGQDPEAFDALFRAFQEAPIEPLPVELLPLELGPVEPAPVEPHPGDSIPVESLPLDPLDLGTPPSDPPGPGDASDLIQGEEPFFDNKAGNSFEWDGTKWVWDEAPGTRSEAGEGTAERDPRNRIILNDPKSAARIYDSSFDVTHELEIGAEGSDPAVAAAQKAYVAAQRELLEKLAAADGAEKKANDCLKKLAALQAQKDAAEADQKAAEKAADAAQKKADAVSDEIDDAEKRAARLERDWQNLANSGLIADWTAKYGAGSHEVAQAKSNLDLQIKRRNEALAEAKALKAKHAELDRDAKAAKKKAADAKNKADAARKAHADKQAECKGQRAAADAAAGAAADAGKKVADARGQAEQAVKDAEAARKKAAAAAAAAAAQKAQVAAQAEKDREQAEADAAKRKAEQAQQRLLAMQRELKAWKEALDKAGHTEQALAVDRAIKGIERDLKDLVNQVQILSGAASGLLSSPGSGPRTTSAASVSGAALSAIQVGYGLLVDYAQAALEGAWKRLLSKRAAEILVAAHGGGKWDVKFVKLGDISAALLVRNEDGTVTVLHLSTKGLSSTTVTPI